VVAILASLLLAASVTVTTGGAAAAGPASSTQSDTKPSATITWCRYVVTADVLNVRSRPFLSAPIVYQLRRGDTVWATRTTVIGDGMTWRSLNYSGTRSQVAVSQYLRQVPYTCHLR
jgi:uncharacterized protein YgiM (DUF1202 family)